MGDVEIENALLPYERDLASTSEAAASAIAGKGDWSNVTGKLASLILSISGHPVLGAFTPLAVAGVARAFGESTTALLKRELLLLEKDGERREFLDKLDAIVATAIGQALIQLASIQHDVKDELLEALGGVRTDFETFRRDFQECLGVMGPLAATQLKNQLVEDGGIGVRLRPDTRNRVFIHDQHVRGRGSVGVEL